MYLLNETDEAEAMRQNVLQLLSSGIVENCLLALQLIKGGGYAPSFYFAYLGSKF